MTAIDFRFRGVSRTATVGMVTLALLAGMLATVAARPTQVLAASAVINVTLPSARTISGTILKKTGTSTTAPAQFPRIEACLVSTTQSLCKSTYTAINGTYTINQLTPGLYTVEISNDDDSLNYQSGWYTTANSAHFTAASASASHVDVTLANKTGVNATIPFGFSIGGVIHLGTSATSIAGVSVIVCSVSGSTCRYVSTIAAGVYSAIGLAPGQYTVEAAASGNYVSGWYRTGVTNNFALTSGLATTLTITTANLTGKTMTLPVGFKITGFVKTTANVAIPSASVIAAGTRLEFASTTATGAFTIQGLPAGTYQVGVSNPYSMPTLTDVIYKSGVTGQYTYSPAAATNIVITTASKALGTIWEPAGRTITGTITKGGVGLAGSTVGAVPTNLPSSVFYNFGGSATTAANGTWSIQGLQPAVYRVRATPPYYPPAGVVGGYYKSGVTGNYTRNLEQGAGVDVTTANKSTLPINLPAGNTISGTIKGGATALAFASVTVYSDSNTEFWYGYATTAANGTYSVTGVPNGRFIVSVTAPDGANFQDGYYRNAPTTNYAHLLSSATPVIFGDGTVPAITAKSPASAAVGVSRTANVTATFSEAVLNATTSTFYLRKAGTTTNVAAVVTYDAVAHKATLNPSVTLAASTSYTVVLYDVYDATGNQAAFTSWTFKTGL